MAMDAAITSGDGNAPPATACNAAAASVATTANVSARTPRSGTLSIDLNRSADRSTGTSVPRSLKRARPALPVADRSQSRRVPARPGAAEPRRTS